MTTHPFGTLPDGREVRRARISAHGLSLSVISLGASIQDLRLDGVAQPLVLGFPTLAPYLDEGRHFGAIVGRCANRIAGAEAQIGARSYRLDANEGGRTTLHGGTDGSSRRNWRIDDVATDHVTLTDLLPDGHMGFPGDLLVRVRYLLMPGPILRIGILATASATTLCNFAPHAYFNLDGKATVADHRLTVPAQTFLPTGPDGIPLAEPRPVEGTALDFRAPALLGPRLGRVEGTRPIDHNLCLRARKRLLAERAAVLRAGGVQMVIETTEPGLQVYTADHLRPGAEGTGGRPFGAHAGIALEPQIWPDAVHHPGWPSPVLRAGEVYRHITMIRFGRVRNG